MTGSLWEDLRSSKAWRLFPLFLIYVTGITVLIPFVPTLMTDFFASRRAGEALHCEDFSKEQAPAACQDAHADVVQWASWTSFASQAVFSLFLTPALGAWSDLYGRRPFMLVAQLCGLAPLTVLLLHITSGFSLLWYYVFNVLSSSVSSTAVALAFVADLLEPQHRAAAFGLIIACFSLGIFIGPAVGAVLSPTTAGWVALATAVVSLLYTLLVLPESLSEEAREEAKRRHLQAHASAIGVRQGPGSVLQAAWKALSILMRNPLFKKLTVCMMLTGLVAEGIQDMLLQYLQLKLNFGVKDQAAVFMIFGICGLVVQTVLLKALLGWLGETRVLLIGLSASCMQLLGIAFARAKWEALAACSLGSLGAVAFPTISSIKSNNAEEHEQGSVQGALYGARALASGMGPLMFAQLFAAFTRSDSRLPFFPGAPFLVGVLLMAAGVAVAWRIPVDAGGSAGSLGGGSSSGSSGQKAAWRPGQGADAESGGSEGMHGPGAAAAAPPAATRLQQERQQQGQLKDMAAASVSSGEPSLEVEAVEDGQLGLPDERRSLLRPISGSGRRR